MFEMFCVFKKEKISLLSGYTRELIGPIYC